MCQFNLTKLRCVCPELAPNQPEYRILIVDDQLENRQLIANLLSIVGFAIRIANNGQEAIALWEDWQPQLILMDMRMPVMDGYEATAKIRQLEKTNPPSSSTIIIALTASAFNDQQARTFDAGCDDFVIKPFREAEIFEKITHYLGVEYVYEEDNSSQFSAVNSELDELRKQILSIMQPEWLKKVNEAATRVNAKLLYELLKEIPQEQESLTTSLTSLINQFRFDLVVEITEFKT